MTKEMQYFLFLIERYADKYKRSTGEVFREWENKGIIQEIFASYFEYHQESLENAFADINSLLNTGKHLEYAEI